MRRKPRPDTDIPLSDGTRLDRLIAPAEAIFATQANGQRGRQVTPKDDELSWSNGNETFDSDPMASAGRRLQAWISRVLDLDAQLRDRVRLGALRAMADKNQEGGIQP